MTPYDKLFLACYFFAILLVQCIWQARLIKKNKPIKHGWHGLYYALSAAPMLYFFSAFWWQALVIAVVTRLAFFDFMLNAIRGKKLFYNSDTKAGSVIDRIENRFSVFWVNALKLSYVAVFIIVIIKLK